MARAGRMLLVASNFPPVRGGSAVVYDNLARFADRRIAVLAPRRNYLDGGVLQGWREHDAVAPYATHRLGLLRTLLRQPGQSPPKPVLLAADLWLRLQIAAAVLFLAARHRAATICIGELLASGWLIGLLRRIPGLRVIAYVHGEEVTTRDDWDPDGARVLRALRQSDVVVVVSRFTQAAVRAALGPADAGKIVLIENGVDPARFQPGPKVPHLLRRYGLGDEFVFVSVCRLVEKKGIDNALRAYAMIADEVPTSRFVIVGTGPCQTELRALAARLGIAGRVVFAGQVAEVELVDHYRLGDAFVMSNRALPNGDTEGFGLVFLEANGCGLPVIAGGDGGSTDAVQHGHNGLVVDGHAVADIAAAMRALRDDAPLRERLRRGGLELAAQAGWAAKAAGLLAASDTRVAPEVHEMVEVSRR